MDPLNSNNKSGYDSWDFIKINNSNKENVVNNNIDKEIHLNSNNKSGYDSWDFIKKNNSNKRKCS